MKRGFTLIELLVVVAIIVALIAILVPSLSRAREQAKSVYCLNNLRSFALANEIYADECDNWYVPLKVNADTNYQQWFKRPLFRQIANIQSDNTYPSYFTRNLMCPDATYALDHPVSANRYDMSYSYGMNATDIADSINPLINSGYYGIRRTAVLVPSQRYLVMDSNDWWVHIINSTLYVSEAPPQSPTYTMAASYRHSGGINLAYYDGHAETQSRKTVDRIFLWSNRNRMNFWYPMRERY